ncbi:T cell activation RhoGTPase activating protein b [Mugil cephalus]|uniref:T cell activation RhoGTPase activating protein b n=1 Tax=Mugil cephalus TaxID=48193 RepID=UPI001FB788F4|nr:T cell activation RhoGTPase activating protein b [Mugil cephalus]
MDTPDCGFAEMRRGSYDDAADSLRPHLRHLAQRRRSAPSLVFGKALGMPWSPIREEAPCWVSVDQSPFVLGLTSENGELLLDECVQVTEGTKTSERHLFLFSDVIVFAKLKSTASYRLKHRVSLEDIWLYGFEDEQEEEDGTTGDIDLRLTVVLAWDLTYCLVCFCSPEVKERWLDTLHRKIKDVKARAACASSPPDVLMKVLSGSIATKTLTGGGMENLIGFPLDGDAKISKQLNHQEDRLTQPTGSGLKRNLMKKLKSGSSFIRKGGHPETDAKTQLFGQPLCKICPEDGSLPRPVMEMLGLLRKRGPSTEGVFRKACNSKNLKDIREQLNCGAEVEMEVQPVVLLVGLLKSFLKELPGSLLVSELYDKWMAALENADAQQRALEITKVTDDLPGPNKLLLQHLICVFHHIHKNAKANKMDANNLAVCIGPTLLLLDDTPLDERQEKMKKASDLTQYLIENCEILGENIPSLLDTDEDSVSSQHHDSAYDSTDPDGDGEAGEGVTCAHKEYGSSSSTSSLSPSTAITSWSSDTVFNGNPPFNRRCSEPIIHPSADLEILRSHARSQDDCSMKRMENFEEQPLKKQISDDSFLLRRQGGAQSVLHFPKLSSSSNMDQLPYMRKDCSCSSLESAASNQSDCSVFTSSPLGSPRCSRRANTASQPSAAPKLAQDIARPISDEKKRSHSFRVTTKVLMRTRSLGAFSRNSMKKDSHKENSFPCEPLQEDSQSEADTPVEPLPKQRPLSAIEVFKQADSKLTPRPPSYQQAVQNACPLPEYRPMTVQDALERRRSRPSSVNYDFPITSSVNQYVFNQDCLGQAEQDTTSVVERRQPFRQRAMSESVFANRHEMVSRRCSQPVFEELSHAKESYV